MTRAPDRGGERRPAITGIGLHTPVGCDPNEFWDALVSGRQGAATVRSFDTTGLPNHIGCEAPPTRLSPRVEERVLGGRCTRLAAAAAEQALLDAGIPRAARGAPIAVVVGTTMGEVTRFEAVRAEHPDRDPEPCDVKSLVERPLDVIARSLARAFALDGPQVTVPAACAAGSYAVGFAASLVARGVVPAALAVGCEAFSRLAFVGFTRMRAMSPDLCRPFSRGRPGLLLGEGAGALLIEPGAAARSRGAPVRAWLDGFGLSCDAHHVTAPHPEGAGAARAMRAAIARAGLDAAQLDYVNAHGTGTPLNDKTESLALRAVFGDRAIPVSSIKSLTGHMMGAAGAVEAIATILALERGVVPPTWNWIEADPDCPIDCVPNAPRAQPLERALSNSYAFGGNNASLLLSASGIPA